MPADSTPEPGFRLTKELRSLCCVHEAGLAIAAALGGKRCREMAVAPLGATKDWCFVTRHDGKPFPGRIGYCVTSAPLTFLQWDTENTDGVDMARVRKIQNALLMAKKPRHRASYYQELRIALRVLLAGLVAETLFLEDSARTEQGLSNGADRDLATASRCCDLLPFCRDRELVHAIKQTTTALDSHWPALMDLAAALYQTGTLDEDAIRPFLPAPLKGWPTPPPRRA